MSYTLENVEKLKQKVYQTIKERILAESEIRLLEEQGKLEKMCFIGMPAQDEIQRRLEPIRALRETRDKYREQEMQLMRQYRTVCETYKDSITIQSKP